MAGTRRRHRCYRVLSFLLVSFLLREGHAFAGTRLSYAGPDAAEGLTPPRGRIFHRRQNSASSSLHNMWSQDNEIQGSDRLKACFPYILPLVDGDKFGHFIYDRFHLLGELNDFLLGPLVAVQTKIPYIGIGLFVLFTLGTRFNSDMNRNVRFSAQQAALIDVALIFPELVGSGFEEDPLPRYIAEPCSNFVWYVYMTAVIYAIVSNLQGKKPDQIPLISPVADLMVGPF